jgi:hypothetical protein
MDLPRIVYIDNGKDYRSTRFEGGQATDYEIGRLNDDFLRAIHAGKRWVWA